MDRLLWLMTGVNGFLAVALGAFGAHGLKGRLADLPDGAERLAWWETAAHYHLVHAVALGLAAVLASSLGGTGSASSGAARASGIAFQVGIVLFSGSLYAMALSGVRWLGAITPLGGLGLLVGWALVVWLALKAR